MQRFLWLIFLTFSSLFGADFDCIFVGTSPICLFEALYQHESGKQVLILEQANECGGAWKAIEVCGVPYADLGCHQISHDRRIKEFLEIYGGCHMVSIDHPETKDNLFSGNGFYFSKGCYELINNLESLIVKQKIPLLKGRKLESAYVDPILSEVIVKSSGEVFSAKKVFCTQMTPFIIENEGATRPPSTTPYFHLYLLIKDSTAPKFSYMSHFDTNASRAMNLTHFVGLYGTGQQLIVLQLRKNEGGEKGDDYLQALKKKNLVAPEASLIQAETYVYNAVYHCHRQLKAPLNAYFEILQTATFASMGGYIEKWQKILRPYQEMIR